MVSLFTVMGDVAERKIREAYDQGEFEVLPGKGAPLALEDDSMVPEDLRMAYKMLKNSGHLPPDLQAVKDIRTTIDLLDECRDEQARVRQMRKLSVLASRLGDGGRLNLLLHSLPEYHRKVLDRVRLAARGGSSGK